jgi:hypothetical protein
VLGPNGDVKEHQARRRSAAWAPSYIAKRRREVSEGLNFPRRFDDLPVEQSG